jgi:transcriptional regulator with XRE-family HTH domain
MLSTAQKMAMKLAEAIQHPPIEQTVIANACGVTKQAVSGWLKTGRFDKKHLPTLARVTGRSLDWWLDSDESKNSSDEELAMLNVLQDWRMHASTRSQTTIDRLTDLAQKNALQEEDWALIESLANRLLHKP